MSDYKVTASALELRSGPGTRYSILEQLSHGSVVSEKAPPNADGWSEVVTARGGRSGWVASRYLAAVRTITPTTVSTDVNTGSVVKTVTSQAATGPDSGKASDRSNSDANVSSVDTSLVFDLSHFNGKVDLAEAYAAGQRGVIHKATEGTGYVDPMYADTRAQAAKVGMLWGAYHFGTGGDAVAQAKHFLATAKPDGNTLLVLDLETNPEGSSMSMAEARRFVSTVQQSTGVWPGLYGGSYVREQLGDSPDEVLGKCWFWLAEYGPHAHVPPAWKEWVLWQYTDGNVGDSPHSISGVGDCDRNRFNGDEQQLLAFWKSHGADTTA